MIKFFAYFMSDWEVALSRYEYIFFKSSEYLYIKLFECCRLGISSNNH